MPDLVTKLVSLLLQLFFAVFWLSVAAYAVNRVASWFYESRRQRTILTVAVLGALVSGWAVNPTRSGSWILRLWHGRVGAGSTSLANSGYSCAKLPLITEPGALGHIDVASVEAAGTSSKLGSGADVRAGDAIILRGWVVPTRFKPGLGVCLVVDGAPTADATTSYGSSRPDVAAALHVPALDASGFNVRYAVSSLMPGQHRVQLGAIDASGTSVVPLSDAYSFTVLAK